MLIQYNPLLHPVRIQIHHPLPVEFRIRLMDYSVMVRTNNHLIIRIVIHAVDVIINMVRLRNMSSIFLADYLSADLASVLFPLRYSPIL